VAIVTIVLVLTLSSGGPCAAQTADQVAAVERSVGILGDLLNASAIAMADIVANESTAASGQPTSCPVELNYACGQGSGRETVSNIDFALPIPAAADYVQLKRYDPPSVMASNATQRRLCSVAELGAHWNTTQRRGQGNVLYQYWAGADNNFGSYPATAWNCSRPYVPTERPYYVAGATGQKDLVVLLDVSNSGGGRGRHSACRNRQGCRPEALGLPLLPRLRRHSAVRRRGQHHAYPAVGAGYSSERCPPPGGADGDRNHAQRHLGQPGRRRVRGRGDA
jgi:hypothetical protein